MRYFFNEGTKFTRAKLLYLKEHSYNLFPFVIFSLFYVVFMHFYYYHFGLIMTFAQRRNVFFNKFYISKFAFISIFIVICFRSRFSLSSSTSSSSSLLLFLLLLLLFRGGRDFYLILQVFLLYNFFLNSSYQL